MSRVIISIPVVAVIRAFLLARAAIAAENLALRQQIIVLQRSLKRPRLHQHHRMPGIWLSRFWLDWRSSLVIVKPETVIRWHRDGFRLYWRWKSLRKPGRPGIDAKVRSLIRRMCRENATWGSPRIQSELALLGYTVDQSTVTKYMCRHRNPPSQTWRTFLENLERNAPIPRQIESRRRGKVIAIPQVGGLHHRYTRAA